MTNHATETGYPTGSSFKPFTLAAALQQGVATPATRMPCLSTWDLQGFTFHNYEDHQLGYSVDLAQAMAFSCNTTYMPLSMLVYNHNRTALTDLIAKFGFGQPTGIGWIAETGGILPDALYFEGHRRGDGSFSPFGPFDQVQLAIGQGSFLGTPLQQGLAYAAFANRGTLWAPRLVQSATLPDGTVVLATEPEVRQPDPRRPGRPGLPGHHPPGGHHLFVWHGHRRVLRVRHPGRRQERHRGERWTGPARLVPGLRPGQRTRRSWSPPSWPASTWAPAARTPRPSSGGS